MNDGLTNPQREEIRTILAKSSKVMRAILFGSRAEGTFGRASDIDLALDGDDLTLIDLLDLRVALSESSLPYDVDLTVRNQIENPRLTERIEAAGVVFYEKAEQKD